MNIDDMEWPDTGCQHSSSCLTCPLAICKHDLPHQIVKMVEHGDVAPKYRPDEIPSAFSKRAVLPSLRGKA